MGLCVSPVGLLNEFRVFLVGLRTGGAGVQLMKVLVAVLTLAMVSSGIDLELAMVSVIHRAVFLDGQVFLVDPTVARGRAHIAIGANLRISGGRSRTRTRYAWGSLLVRATISSNAAMSFSVKVTVMA
jgi:hypothetical protein